MNKRVNQAERQRLVIEDVLHERRRQARQWGGDKHDDRHTPGDFASFIEHQLAKRPYRKDRPAMVKIAALAMACIEMLDRESERAGGRR